MNIIKIFAWIFVIPILILGSFFLSVLFHEWLHTRERLPDVAEAICINLNPNPKADYIAYTTFGGSEQDFNINNHGFIYFVQGMFFIVIFIFAWIFVGHLL